VEVDGSEDYWAKLFKTNQDEAERATIPHSPMKREPPGAHCCAGEDDGGGAGGLCALADAQPGGGAGSGGGGRGGAPADAPPRGGTGCGVGVGGGHDEDDGGGWGHELAGLSLPALSSVPRRLRAGVRRVDNWQRHPFERFNSDEEVRRPKKEVWERRRFGRMARPADSDDYLSDPEFGPSAVRTETNTS